MLLAMNLIYKFKITIEEEEEFLRELEINANSTFEEFHFAILKAVGLEGEELASFFICDDLWNKAKEITLLDMSEDENRIDIMNDCILKDYIVDPNQKLIYEYDFLNLWTFLIELVKTKTPQAKVAYPKCVKSVGKLTPKIKVSNSFLPADFTEDDFEITDKEFEAFSEDELNEGFEFDSDEFGEGFDDK